MWSVVCTLFVVVAFACHWLLRQRRKCFDAFDGTGVPTVPLRSWINGNSDEFWKPSTIERISQWMKEYGNVFGFFLGDTPFVVIGDLEMINEIFVKDSSKFQRRGHLFHIYEHNPLFAGYVMFLKGSQWQAPRSCMSQFFTSSKLRAVMPSLLNAQKQLVNILGEHADSGVEVDIDGLCERFTFDVICKAAFSLDTNVQRNPDNPLFKKAITVVPNVNSGFLYHLGQNLYHWPWLLRLPSKVLGAFYTNPLVDMTTRAAEIIMYRRTNPQVRVPDMAQILLDNLVDAEVTEVRKSAVSKESEEAPLPEEILNRLASNGMAVFIGGYEPAKVVMTNWFYVMGRYPDVQEKMRQEALEAFAKEGDHLSLQTLTTLPYSNQVIFETMRLYPAAVIATTRSSDEDYRYGKYVIKKGTSVMVPTYQLHHDPKYWNEPEKFDPERFSPENKHSINPTAYQPFGLGPRMCPGHRLALAEIVSAAAEILRHYSITLGRSQKHDLELRTYSIMAASKEKVFIRLRRLHAK